MTSEPTELPDGERAALAELARRRFRIKLAVMSVAVVAGIVGGVAAYWISIGLQPPANPYISHHGPDVIGAVALIVPFLIAMAIGRLIAVRLVRARTPALTIAVAQQHGLPVERLAETARLLDGL